MSVERKSNITADRKSKIVTQMKIAIQHAYAAECNAEISKIMAEFDDFVKLYPAKMYVGKLYTVVVCSREFCNIVLEMVADFYEIAEISRTVWKKARSRDGDPIMYEYRFIPRIGSVVPPPQPYPIT